MGKIRVTAKFENLCDLYEVDSGARAEGDVRSVMVGEALVDTGAMILAMPERLIRKLGLRLAGERRARSPGGVVTVPIFDPVRLTIGDREGRCGVAGLPEDGPVQIGRIPLMLLDLIVNPVGQRLIGNPTHGGRPLLDSY